MRVTDIKVHVLRSSLSQRFAFSQGWVRHRSATLVEVQTDQGVTGWGEANDRERTREQCDSRKNQDVFPHRKSSE